MPRPSLEEDVSPLLWQVLGILSESLECYPLDQVKVHSFTWWGRARGALINMFSSVQSLDLSDSFATPWTAL